MESIDGRRKTILFVSHDASRTGAPIFLLRFLKWFRSNRSIPFRILVGGAGDLLPEFRAIAAVDSFAPKRTIPYRLQRRLGLNGARDRDHRAALRDSLERDRIGLIYANTIATGQMLQFLSFLRCPTICHVHELEGAIKDRGADNMNLVSENASEFIAVSHAVKQNLVTSHNLAPERIQTIHGFVPIRNNGESPEHELNTDVRKELGLPPGAKIVLGCGSLERRKGIDLFVDVAQEVLANCNFPVHFVWVGDGPEPVERIRKIVAAKSLGHVVHFVGRRHNVASYYRDADLFLLTSREDPFPLVVLEAAAWGKPIVCFDNAGGTPEFVETDSGFSTPGFDTEEMARKTIDLLESDDMRTSMGRVAKQKVIDKYSLELGAAKIASVIDRALS